VGLLSVIIALSLLLLGIFWWRRRGYETVDFADVAARRRSAAMWLASGESDAAEEMMRAAIATLSGWPRALAHGDLASVLMALERNEEAIDQLALACGLATGHAGERVELLEMRIRWARLLRSAGRSAEAEDVLLAADASRDDSIDSALAVEALAEFYVDEGRADEAIAILGPAFSRLAKEQHDRAAAAAVTLAWAQQLSGAVAPWQCLEALPADLQTAAVGNFCDRLPAIDAGLRTPMLESLLSLLSKSSEFEGECQELRAAAQALAG
jgi:tetratricopeptide (TPR) repeat protein